MAVRLFVLACVGLLLLASSVAHAQRAPGRPKPAGKTGQLVVRVTTDDADVLVDGASVGRSPLAGPLTLPVGVHSLKVLKAGFAEYLDTVKIGTNETTTVEVDMFPL